MIQFRQKIFVKSKVTAAMYGGVRAKRNTDKVAHKINMKLKRVFSPKKAELDKLADEQYLRQLSDKKSAMFEAVKAKHKMKEGVAKTVKEVAELRYNTPGELTEKGLEFVTTKPVAASIVVPSYACAIPGATAAGLAVDEAVRRNVPIYKKATNKIKDRVFTHDRREKIAKTADMMLGQVTI